MWYQMFTWFGGRAGGQNAADSGGESRLRLPGPGKCREMARPVC